MKPLQAERREIKPSLIRQAEVDEARVQRLIAARAAGGKFPPVVVVQYGDVYMPIDGHHRMTADARLGMRTDAFVVIGSKFEGIDRKAQALDPPQDGEDFVMCDGVLANDVADHWRRNQLFMSGWTVDRVSLYDEEGVEGWRWMSLDRRELSVIGDWNEPAPIPEELD